MGKGDGAWKAFLAVVFTIGGIGIIMITLILLGVVGGSNAAKAKAVTDAINDGSTTDKDVVSLSTCTSDTTPDIDVNAYDSFNPGTALTEGTNLYRKVGGTTWTAFTAGTAIANLEKDREYEVVMGISASDFTDNAYGGYFKYTVPCADDSFDKPMFNDEVETSIIATFYNDNGDAAAQNFSIAGATKEVQIKASAGSDEVFGNPFISGFEDNEGNKVAATTVDGPDSHRKAYPNMGCMDLNSTVYDAPEKVTYKGVELKKVSQPTRHAAATGKTTYCYEWPIITDTMDKVLIKLNADDTTRPITDDTLSLYAGGFYIDADTGDVKWGVENEEGAAVGTDAAATVTLDATA